jgi:hypothetical protein
MTTTTTAPQNTGPQNGMTLGTLAYGSFLVLLGLASYFLTGRQSVTALIPSFFGLVVLPMGLLALTKPTHKRHFLHVAAALSLLGIAGTFKGFIRFFKMLGGEEVLRPEATTAQASMCLISLIYLAFCIRSFVAARMAQKSA